MATSCTVDDAFGIAEGDAVCVVGWDAGVNPHRPKVARSTRANLAKSKTVYGVATEDADDTDQIDILVAGEVASADDVNTELDVGAGPGTSRIIATDINQTDPDPATEAALQCRLIRIDRPNGSEYIVGTCDENGNLAVVPRASQETSAHHVYNVLAYGADPTGVADSAPAVRAVLSAMAEAGAGFGGTIYFPPQSDGSAATYAFKSLDAANGCENAAVSIGQRVLITGPAVAGGYAQVVIQCDPGISAFQIEHSARSAEQTSGAFTVIENLTINSTVTDYDAWTERNYAAGEKVRKTDENVYYYECTVGGDSGAVEPFGAPDDGGGPMTDVIVDGDVRWKRRLHAGIIVKSRAFLERLVIGSFTNAAIHVQAGASPDEWGALDETNANAAAMRDVNSALCGLGYFARGQNANGCELTNVEVSAMGFGQTGIGGHGFHVSSFLGNVLYNCQAAAGTGRAFIMDNPAGYQNALIACYSEEDMRPSVVQIPAMVVGGNHGAGFTSYTDPTSPTTATLVTALRSQVISTLHDSVTAPLLKARLDPDPNTVFAFSTSDEQGNWIGWRYGYQVPSGWWGFGYGNSGAKNAFVVSSTAAGFDPSPGWLSFELGFLMGDPSVDVLLFDGNIGALTSRLLRNGLRRTGDRFRELGRTRVMTTDGYRGLPWLAGQPYVARVTLWSIPASMVEPTANGADPGPGLPVFECIRDHTSGLTEPNWAGAVVIGDKVQVGGLDTWELVGFTPSWTLLDRAGGKAFASVVAADDLTASAGDSIAVTVAAKTVTLPASPADGDEVEVLNVSGGNITANAGLKTIYGVAASTETLGDDDARTYRYLGGGIDAWMRAAR